MSRPMVGAAGEGGRVMVVRAVALDSVDVDDVVECGV